MKTFHYFAFALLILTGCGGSSTAPISPKAATQTTPPGETVISNIQTSSGNWQSWLQFPPTFTDCLTPCSGSSIEQIFGVADPSKSGNATMFELNPATPYADALFSAQLIGQNSPQTPDDSHTLLPTIHNFIYDSDFYVTNASITQVLEFDVSMYLNGAGMIFGTQCDHLGDGDWDIWDNVKNAWVSAGAPCQFVNGWNHVTINVQRESDNSLFYESIELNGATYPINKTYPPGVADSGWWGVTLNYQMDGNATTDSNTTYVDNLSLTYW
jgi:hypothetical protein